MRVHHLALRTTDVEGLAAYYTQTFGLRVVRDARPRSLWLGLETAVLMIEARGDGEPEVPRGTLELIAFAVDEATRTRMRAALLADDALEGETAHTLYFRDPEGRRLAVSTYPLESARR